jgi:NHLM bacteriocin system ABC transporter ATP-binding protein
MAIDRAAALSGEGGPAGAAAVDRWIVGLSESLVASASRPRVDLLLAAGDSLLEDSPRRVSAAAAVVWCSASAPGVMFIDLEALEPGAPPTPVAHETWLTAPAGAGISGGPTADLMAAGRLPAALDAFHRVVADLLPISLRLAAADELNRLRLRAEGDRRAAARAMDVLAAVFGSRPVSAAQPVSDDPLLQAMGRLGEVQGFQVMAPVRTGEDAAIPLTHDEVAEESRLRQRRVRLEAGWWRSPSSPFLLLRPKGPAAVWFAGRGYRLFDPAEGADRRLAPAEAALLEGEAVSFYAPLPDRPLKVGGLLFGALRLQAADLVTLVGATVLAGVLGLAVPLATTYLLDDVIPDNDRGKLFEAAVALLLVAGLTFLLRNAAQLASLRIEGIAGGRLQAAIMDRLLRLPARFFRRFTTGELATRVLAVERLENALTAAMVGTLMTGAVAIISLGLMLAYSPALGLAAVVLTLGMGVMGVLLGFSRVRHEARAVDQDAKVVGLTLELAGGVAKLRLAAAEERAFLRWAQRYAAARRSRLDAERAAGRLTAGTAGYTGLAAACIIAVCVYARLAPGLSLGLLVAFLAAFNSALAGLAALANTAVAVLALAPVARYAAPILETAPEADVAKADPGVLSGAIEVSHLKFQYQPDMPPVFDDLSLKVKPGEFVAIVGPSGTGKSTLLRLLLGFEQPNSGLIQYDGLDLQGLDLPQVRRQCGVVLQGGKLMAGALLDNILGANMQLGEAEAWEAAALVGLDVDLRRMPMGLQTQITDGGGVLSGGQVQRLLLARALVGRPRILLLDEATSALDNRTQAVVTESLNQFAATRLVIAHRLSTVQDADRIVVLNEGRVVEEGDFQTLMANQAFFAQLARRQLTRPAAG